METSDLTHRLFRSVATATGMPVPAVDNSITLSDTERLAGLGGVILMILALYIIGALANGLMFFLMTWAGQNVLRRIAHRRVQAIAPACRLGSMASTRPGDLMSRITNDSRNNRPGV